MKNKFKSPSRAFVLAALATLAGTAHACSVCIAHALGSAIHAIGSQTLPKGVTIVGVTYETFNKSQAGEIPGTAESHHQTQLDFQAIHGLTDNIMLQLDVPYVYKSLAATGEDRVNTKGLGDITLGATYQAKPNVNDKVLLAFTADVKFATGADNLKDGLGDRLEEHAQIGTGSTDATLGVLATAEAEGGLAFAGLSYRFNGRNSHDYHYGDALFYNLGYSHRLPNASSIVLEFNGRFAKKDNDAGVIDDNSGGHLAYLSLSYRKSLGKDFGFVGTYQIPVLRNLNGSQSESGMLTLGVFKKL